MSASIKFPKRVVRRVTQSPMNPHRWLFDLECGHEEWVTSKTRPARKRAECGKCWQAAKPKPEEPT